MKIAIKSKILNSVVLNLYVKFKTTFVQQNKQHLTTQNKTKFECCLKYFSVRLQVCF